MKKSYVGQVLEICEEDCTIHISFIVKCREIKGRYHWPVVEDTDIVQVVDDPTSTIASSGMFSFPASVLKLLIYGTLNALY